MFFEEYISRMWIIVETSRYTVAFGTVCHVDLKTAIDNWVDEGRVQPLAVLTSLTRDEDFGPNMNITSQAREQKVGSQT